MEHLGGQATTRLAADGTEWSLTAWTCIILISGATTDEDGVPFEPEQLARRMPVRPFQLVAES